MRFHKTGVTVKCHPVLFMLFYLTATVKCSECSCFEKKDGTNTLLNNQIFH